MYMRVTPTNEKWGNKLVGEEEGVYGRTWKEEGKGK